MASLIRECSKIKRKHEFKTKIVADGGFKKFSDIIKALALGSDYVMLGGIINKSLESSSPCYSKSNIDGYSEINVEEAKKLMGRGETVYKYFRGMSTKEVQSKWGREKLKTAEGISKYNKVEYSIESWVNNFEDYLKSNMSYCNKRSLEEYIGEVKFRFMTPEAYARFNK